MVAARPATVAGLVAAVWGASACGFLGEPALVSHLRLARERGGALEPPPIAMVEGAPPETRWLGVHGDERPSLVFAAPARFRFQVEVPREARFSFGVVVRPIEAPVRLRIRVEGEERDLHDEVWQQQRPWQDRGLDLTAFRGRTVWMEVRIDGPPATVALGAPEIVGRGRAPRPNVVLYVVDCLRADHVGAYGYARGATPSIDRLAAEGVVFERAYSCAAWTKPSIGCLFTSTYPWRHGARTLDDSLAHDVTTLAEVFQAAGYATHAWVANPVVDREHFGFGRGFDRFLALARRFAGRNVNAAGAEADAATLNESLVWLEQNRRRAFFLYLHSLDLHAPYLPRPPFDAAFARAAATGAERDRDLYDGELAYNDQQIGRLREGLERLGLYEDTVIVVTADHGEEFMEHGTAQHGRSVYDTLLHVPLVVKLPARRPATRRVAAAVGTLDVGPTLLDYAGLPRPPQFEGLSLRGLVEGASPAPARPLFAEQLGPRQSLYAVRDGRLKYVRQLVPEPRELLFDLERDPAERVSLLPGATVPPALAEALASFVQRGLDGYHVVLDEHAGGPRRVRGEAEDGFRDVVRLVMRTGDELKLAADGRSFEYSSAAGEPARHLVVRPARPGAPLRLWIGSGQRALDGARVVVGEPGRRAPAMPFTADPSASGVASYGAGAALRSQAAGAWVFYLAPRSARVDLAADPELADRLRALGYVQ
jgi:arylsulfatase A-like enzyme